MKKKDFPLIVLQNMQDLKQRISDDIAIVHDNSILLKFVDKDSDSNFFFTIQSYEEKNKSYTYYICHKPGSERDINDVKFATDYKNLIHGFEIWKSLINKYNDQIFFKEDLILDSYAKEFYEEYKLIDDSADIAPFDLPRQIIIDNYLEQSILYLKQLEPSENIDVDELIQYATEIKESHAKLTKNATIKMLSKFWALSRENGIPVLKKVFIELASELIIKIGKNMLFLE